MHLRILARERAETFDVKRKITAIKNGWLIRYIYALIEFIAATPQTDCLSIQPIARLIIGGSNFQDSLATDQKRWS